MNAKKIVCFLLVFTMAGAAVLIAQTSRQVDDWLRTAEQKARRAYSLAQNDVDGNADSIVNLISDVRLILGRVENYIMSGNELTPQQEERLQKINADLYSIQRLMSY